MPAVISTKVKPTAQIQSVETCFAMLMKLLTIRNWGVQMRKGDDQCHEDQHDADLLGVRH